MTKADATLSMMVHILFKMKDTSHTAWVIDPQSNLELCNKLCNVRDECSTEGYAYGKPGPRLTNGDWKVYQEY